MDPTISTLKQAVVQAENAMKAKKLNGFGLLKDRFHSLIQTLDDHKYMFAIIPQGDRYVSLFTGVVSFIAKVSGLSRPDLASHLNHTMEM